MCRGFAVFVLMVACPLMAVAATQARTENFLVVSNLEADVVAQAAAALESHQHRLASLGFERAEPDLPVVAVIVPTVADLAPFLDSNGLGLGRSRALSFIGADRNYIILAWYAPGAPSTALAHELAHLADPNRDQPAWLREGVSEYVAHLAPAEDGSLRPFPSSSHLARLAAAPWLSLNQLMGAQPDTELFRAPTFYPQAWLTVSWLISRGAAPAGLSPSMLLAEIRSRGREAVEAELETLAATLRAQLPAPDEAETPGGESAEDVEPWRYDFWLAEVQRELRRWGPARDRLERLSEAHPNTPQIEGALGSMAMDQNRYDEAEPLLRAAASAPDAEARIRYRYALMLLSPSPGGSAIERGLEASAQLKPAVGRHPAVAEYRLALAQAYMVAEAWESAAGELRVLARDPDRRERAEAEFAELLRRRQQSLRLMESPALHGPAASAELTLKLDDPVVAPPPDPPPPPKPSTWPPPGVSIAIGQIDFVDCEGPDKIIVLKHPLFSMRFREPKGRPAKLYSPPKGWQTLPCEARGMLVNVAYKPSPKIGPIRGEAVAVLF